VKVFPGDNLMVHKSLDVLERGDVVVVDAGHERCGVEVAGLVRFRVSGTTSASSAASSWSATPSSTSSGQSATTSSHGS